ncbi:hypothetical protein ACFVY9_32135 [Streptomyces sp. NPDC059544]|uniref:hypothetical protein n=1 Tax=Streptomyces sp. NPDC059544 TaxID=3346861 RepID=UPI0036A07072
MCGVVDEGEGERAGGPGPWAIRRHAPGPPEELPAQPRRQVEVADAVVYVAVLLLTAVLSAWSVGDDAPFDAAFVLAIISLFTLRLPAAWLLSLWRSGHLEVVLVQRGTAREAGKPAE